MISIMIFIGIGSGYYLYNRGKSKGIGIGREQVLSENISRYDKMEEYYRSLDEHLKMFEDAK